MASKQTSRDAPHAAARKYLGEGGVKRSYALLLRQSLYGIGAAVVAYLLGRCTLLFGTRPLGIALLCAATSAVPYLFGGLLVSALTAGAPAAALCAAYTAALVIRMLSRSTIDLPADDADEPADDADEPAETPRPTWRTLPSRCAAWLARWFGESVYLRMMTSCVCAFLVSLYTIIAGGFVYYDLFGAFFSMSLAPVATYVYAGLFLPAASDAAAPRRARRGAWLSALPLTALRRGGAWGALVLSSVYALRGLSLLGIDLAAFVGFLLMLVLTRRRGLLAGMCAGLLAGVAYAPVAVPSFVLAAPVFGLLLRLSRLPAAAAACAVALGWALIVDGVAALTTVLPAYLAATLLACAADRLILHPAALLSLTPDVHVLEASEQTDIALQRVAYSEARLRELSATFSSLSAVFYDLSDRLRRPALLDLRRMCDGAFDRVCPSCPHRELCWGADYAGTLSCLSRMAAALHERGYVAPEDADETLRARCPSLETLLSHMNAECARLTEAALRTEGTEMLAMDYEGLSQILGDALEEQNAEFCYDEALCARVRETLSDMSLHAQGVLVYGRRRRHIVARGVDASLSRLGAQDIRTRLEQVCECALGDVCFDLSDTGVTMHTERCPMLTTRHAFAVSAAQDGVCGDTVNVFDTPQDYTYALISDGMGTGREAAFTSGLCSLFLERLLTAGNRTDTALRMLNSMIRQKGGAIGMECSATIDLLELDLLTGKAVFLKSGACPTYVRRDDCLFRLHAETAPIGILRAVDARRIVYDAQAGDVIIMLSDGIADAQPDDAPDPLWLLDLLADGWEGSAAHMAQRIVDGARACGGMDDVSVVLVEVLAAER